MRLKEYKEGGAPADRKTYAYNYLISKGLPAVQASGIIGNLHAESGLNTTIKGTADDKGSVGLAQWHSERKTGLYNFAKRQGKDWGSLDLQLDYILEELSTTEKKAMKSLQAARTPQEATMAFMNDYERPAEWAKNQSRGARVNAALQLSGMDPDLNFKVQGYEGSQAYGQEDIETSSRNLRNAYGQLYYNEDGTQNVSSLDNAQESSKLAQEKQDRAAEIKARLDQKAAEKTFMAEMIQKSQVAYVNPADYQAQPASVNYQAPQQFQKGGISSYKEQDYLERFSDIVSNPLTSFGYIARNENIPKYLDRGLKSGAIKRNVLDNTLDLVNPVYYANSAGRAAKNVIKGEAEEFAGEALNFVPVMKVATGATRVIKNANKIKNTVNAVGVSDAVLHATTGKDLMPPTNKKQQGGNIPISSQGVYDYPNQEVIVPTEDGRITMKNVSYPILGTDEYGNKQMMQPGGEYKFPGKTIHEKPQQFQKGGALPWYQDAGIFRKKWGAEPETLYNTLTKAPTSLNEQALAAGVPAGQGVYIGEKGNQTYVSPDNILNEVAVKAYKKPSNQIDVNKIKSKEEIESTQKKLVDFGYDLGRYGANKNGVDGLVGKRTTEALKSYNEIVKYQEEYDKGDKKNKVENFIIDRLGKREYNKRELELFRDSDYLKNRPELMDEDVKRQIEVNKKSKHINSDYLVISDKNARGYIFDKNNNIVKTFKTVQGKDTGEDTKINSKEWVKANPGKNFTDYVDYLGKTNKKYTPSGVFFVGRKDEDYSGLKSDSFFGKALIEGREVLGNLGLSTTNDERRAKREHSYGDVGLISLKRLSGDGIGEAIHSTGTDERTQNLSGVSTAKDRKMSSGCINVGDEDMGFCFDNLKQDTPVFLLREDGVNLSPDVLKFKNANKTQRVVANGLYNNYDKLKKEFGEETDNYINYATGILGNESSFGNMSAYGEVKETLAESQAIRKLLGKKGDASIGAAQIKWSGVSSEIREKLLKFGISDEQDLKDNNKSAIAAMFVFRDKVKNNGNTLAGGVKGYLGAKDVNSKKVKNYLGRVVN